jgi:hypothetical protein
MRLDYANLESAEALDEYSYSVYPILKTLGGKRLFSPFPSVFAGKKSPPESPWAGACE